MEVVSVDLYREVVSGYRWSFHCIIMANTVIIGTPDSINHGSVKGNGIHDRPGLSFRQQVMVAMQAMRQELSTCFK